MAVNRTTTTYDIKSLIGTTEENTKTYFEPNRDTKTEAKIRIPEHQRYYCWDSSKQEPLIDTIMTGYPMPLMVFTEHTINGSSIFNVQDGQQRLITLQNYILGHYTWNNKRYSDLSMDEKLVFLGYKISCEVIKDPTENQIAEIFERLNSGKPLTDNDKFWNRRNLPVIQFLFNELIPTESLREGFKKYIGKIGEGKNRSKLSDMVGAIVAIYTKSPYNIRTSFERIGPHLHIELNESQKQNIIGTFQEYFAIIEMAMNEKSIAKPKKEYAKLSNMFGIYLYWKLTEEINSDAIEKWKWYAWNIQDRTWRNNYFGTLMPGARRNIDIEALKTRTNFLIHSNYECQLTTNNNEVYTTDEEDEETE